MAVIDLTAPEVPPMTRFLAASALVVGLSGCAVRADERDIPLGKVPARAADAVKMQFPDAKLVEASTDTADGVTSQGEHNHEFLGW